MTRSKFMAAFAALALTAAPTMASAQTTAAPARAAAPVAAPAGEYVDEDSELLGRRGTGFIIPFLAVLSVVIAILLFTGDDDEEEMSP